MNIDALIGAGASAGLIAMTMVAKWLIQRHNQAGEGEVPPSSARASQRMIDVVEENAKRLAALHRRLDEASGDRAVIVSKVNDLEKLNPVHPSTGTPRAWCKVEELGPKLDKMGSSLDSLDGSVKTLQGSVNTLTTAIRNGGGRNG